MFVIKIKKKQKKTLLQKQTKKTANKLIAVKQLN